MEESVTLTLSKDEALVLFDWIVRFNKREGESFEDQAEQRMLWDLEAILEKALTEPFELDYDQHLSEARRNVRDSTE